MSKHFSFYLVKIITTISCFCYFLLCLGCADQTMTEKQPTRPTLVSQDGAFDAPSVRTFPSPPDKIQTWIKQGNLPKIRSHAWDLWESITTDTSEGANFPIWETWYTGHEIFDMEDPEKKPFAKVRVFEDPAQFTHFSSGVTSTIPRDSPQQPASFNKFSKSLADVIVERGFNEQSTLNRANTGFNGSNTPVADREISTSIDSIDVQSFALKPVFQFISGSEPTALPYWRGNSTFYSTDQLNPEPHTWRQCVVVDPTGNLTPGSTHTMSCNGEMGDWPVVSLDDIYHFTLTAAEAEAYSVFAETSGDDLGKNNQADSSSIAEMVKEGNIALMMAMHVTGKEIVNWTWQTFWWSPDADTKPWGHDRPASILSPWNNYNTRTAYFMTWNNNAPTGEPLIAFSPYLETNLTGNFIYKQDTVGWKGVFSNCMTCHRLAAFPGSQYTSGGFVDKGDPLLFSKNVKTDFLWSIPTRAKATK